MTWIKDRVPDTKETVFVRLLFKDGNKEVGTGVYLPHSHIWHVTDSDGGEFSVANGDTFASVTGWMPFPEYGAD